MDSMLSMSLEDMISIYNDIKKKETENLEVIRDDLKSLVNLLPLSPENKDNRVEAIVKNIKVYADAHKVSGLMESLINARK